MRPAWQFVVAACVVGVTLPAGVLACGSCAVGDPTITVMGAEQPATNRLRMSMTMRHLNDRIGEPQVDALQLSEQRLELGGAYSPIDRLTVSAMVPLVHRRVTEVNLAEYSAWSAGDVDVRIRGVVYRDRAFAPRHLLTLIGGLELPTSSAKRDAAGQSLPLEFQPGSGSWDPIAGLGYTLFRNPWSVYASAIATVPTKGHNDARGGAYVRQSLIAQYQPIKVLAFQAGAEVRGERPTKVDGQTEQNSGGWVGFGIVGLVALPHPDVVLHLAAAIPVLERLNGAHEHSLSLTAGIVYEI